MYLAQIPFFPANRANFNIDEIGGLPEAIHALYPEIFFLITSKIGWFRLIQKENSR